MKDVQVGKERTFKRTQLWILCSIPCFVIAAAAFCVFQVKSIRSGQRIPTYEGRHLLQDASDLFDCIPSGITAFAGDFFTQEQRLRGGVSIHFLLVAYICAMIAIVCDHYFIPSLDIISDKLNLPPDIAGATFMAIGTSAPELFSSITGSFITEGDIGVGTIIGSAVFNILAVTGVVGLVLWNEELDIEWFPIARDCTAYGLTISCLIWIISDNVVRWWEALILLTVFMFYILLICYNTRVERMIRKIASKISCHRCCEPEEEIQPILSRQIIIPELDRLGKYRERDSFSVEITASREQAVLEGNIAANDELDYSDDYSDGTPCSPPAGGPWSYVWWILTYPAQVLFYLTIPDSSLERGCKWYPLTFLLSVAWIGVLSYLAVWMVTIIGYTFAIPDSISGVTILAAGTSIPEIVTSVIVAKSGLGNMAISNLVGSNTFDISFCLGAPWLIKALVSKGYLIVYSSSLIYTTATLLLTLIAYVLVFQLFKWKINRAVGVVCLLFYSVFVILACLYELNVFGDLNLPLCAV